MSRTRLPAEQRKEQILAKAAELFATYGYEGTKIWQVAEACQITDGAVLHFFKDKRTLYMQTFIHTITKYIPVNDGAGKSREMRLVSIAENILDQCRNDPSTMRLLLQVFLSDREQTGFYYHSIMNKGILADVGSLISQGVNDGEYSVEDSHLSAICFLGITVYLAMCHEFFGADSLKNKTPAQLAELTAGLFLNGIRKSGD